jgi:hypothetical protein
MSYPHTAMKRGPGNGGIVEEKPNTDFHTEHEGGGTDNRGRRWYHLRPEPRRRTDLIGFNSRWWMAVGWLILILLVVFPFPFWSW